MIGLDHRLERWAVHHRTAWLDVVFEGLSVAGTLGIVWLAIALALAALWRRPQIFFLTAAGDAAAQLASLAIKLAVDRKRPALVYPEPEPLVSVPTDNAFPSGHAASSFACATLLALAAPRLAAPLFLLAAGIAVSRVYVGVHYPLDILGGAVLGVAVATALRWLAAARRRRAPLPTRG